MRPQLEAQLEAGETLEGIVAATQQKTFSGQLYAVGVTNRRLLLQPVDRKLQPKGPSTVLTPELLASTDAGGAGGGWWSPGSAMLDAAAITVELRTTAGEKFKLMMMKGGGPLGGGEAQQDGVLALAEWMRRRFDPA